MARQMITQDEAIDAKVQHRRPCSDCPFARTALNGWLGGGTVDEWTRTAHGDGPMPCHTLRGAECAGAAIYRANVCKSPRHTTFRLPADRAAVFSTPAEFSEHHARPPQMEPAE